MNKAELVLAVAAVFMLKKILTESGHVENENPLVLK